MASPNWPLFGVVVLLATVVLVVLSRASSRAISGDAGPPVDSAGDERHPADGPGATSGPPGDGQHPPATPQASPVPTGGALLANVALTQGLLGVGLLVLAWYASVPLSTLGLVPVTPDALAVGLGVGVGLYVASETATTVADRAGVDHDERLRELLAPSRPAEWALLLLVLLPIVAFAEELLFRGVLVGALAAGFGLPAWALAVVSSALFGGSHSAQGAVGVAVTATLGLVLAAAFVLTGNLAVVVLAHYVIDALEFVVEEGVRG